MTIENHAFEDVVVYHVPRNLRIGDVSGLKERTFEVCPLVNLDPIFAIRAIGGRFTISVRGVVPFEKDTHLRVVIEQNPRFSYVIGQQQVQ